jgi:hypothetical protein
MGAPSSTSSGPGLELELGVVEAPLGVDDQPLAEEGVAHPTALFSTPAGVVAQVEHQALEAALVLVLEVRRWP